MSSDNSQPAALRDHTGRFQPGGGSPNPGGRPALVREVRDLARIHTALAVQTLAAICADPKAAAHSRVSAADALLCRAWGRPSQAIEVSRGPDTRDFIQMSDAELIDFARQNGVSSVTIDSFAANFGDVSV